MDPLDTDPKLKELGARAKFLTVNLQAGKKYVIQLNSNQFDCFLRLMDGGGNAVASDDDSGGGLNARIDFDCTVSATYGVVVTSFDGKMGQFQLVVTRVK
jgi:hypothetical protein